ncbi:MAG: glycoside hydrolase family 5 protein [Pelobium sp.]
MVKTLLILLFISLISCKSKQLISQQHPLSDAVENHGWLAINNGKIVDEKGNTPQLRGVSLSWSIWGGKKYYNAKVIDWLIKDFKVNVIRLSMAVQPKGGYIENPKEQKELIFSVIDSAIANGIYVMMDWHDHHGELHVAESKAFFSEVSSKYASYPNMIYEIWNEPERQSWEVVKKYAYEVIPEIRKHTKRNLIVVGSPHWDQDIDMVAVDPLKNVVNIAYSFHFYSSEPAHQEALMAKANVALKKGLPIFITEWGVGEADGNGTFDKEKTAKWMDWMELNKLS